MGRLGIDHGAANRISLAASPGKDATLEEFDGKRWSIADNAKESEVISLVVEQGHVFVLGENRSKSHDSRVFGSVPMADVVGKARQNWFSRNEDGIRWDRIGQVFD
ncbi:MAG: S26 family signal peptidase [Granulosicoccus sp.]